VIPVDIGEVGAGPIVAVEQAVVLRSDPASARAIAREHLAAYLKLPNYVNNWLRSGYSTDDLSNGGSDRPVDDMVGWGDADEIALVSARTMRPGLTTCACRYLAASGRCPMTSGRP
jgi:hypothetical protein